MKVNINLECFAKRKDPFTEKTKCQVLFCKRYRGKIIMGE